MRSLIRYILPVILIGVSAGCSRIQLPSFSDAPSKQEKRDTEPPSFDPRNMDKTASWVDWTVKKFTPRSENPLVKDEAIERIKAEFDTVRGHEVQWDAVVRERGKTQQGADYR